MELFIFKSKKKNPHTDAEYVEGVFKGNKKLTDELFEVCHTYFKNHFKGVFFKEADENETDIFQNSMIKLWENIENGKLYVEDGILKGKDNEPFTGALTTYFMRIANLKYLEWVRNHPVSRHNDTNSPAVLKGLKEDPIDFSILYGNSDNVMIEIIADCISHMSERCNQILTMYYVKKKKLQDIWPEIPTITTYNALKTEKYKCKVKLENCANGIYDEYVKQ